MKIEINVTQEDIDNGLECDSDKCAVALALRRLFPDCTSVGVCQAYAVVDGPGESRRCFDMPEQASRFITAFDCGRHVEPFSFSMDECGTQLLAESTKEA